MSLPHDHQSAHRSRERCTYIVVRKHHTLVDLLDSAILLLEPPPVLLDHLPEDRPLDATNKASFLPAVRSRYRGFIAAFDDLLVKPSDYLLAPVHPLVPVLPNKWASFSFFLEKFDTLVKLSHSLGNLLRRLGNSQLLEGKWFGVEELLEATVLEGPKHSWSNTLAS